MTGEAGGAERRGRVEDGRLLRGGGRYSSDLHLAGELHAVFVRSPHAHAEIVGIGTGAAASAPGVRLVLTGADTHAAGFGGLPCNPGPTNRDGSKMVVPRWPSLAEERVRHVGDCVALVVADTLAEALDGAELVEVEYRDLPAAVDTAVARPGAPAVWPHAPDNVALDFAAGDERAVAAAFSKAARIVSATVVSRRVVVSAMEPRAAAAEYDAATDRYTLNVGSQGAVTLRGQVASVLNVAPDRLRVVSRDVGGGFGMKTPAYPEYGPLLLAAKRLGRPVRWTATRSESFLSDTQGRDSVLNGELALDGDGRFLACRIDAVANMGAYLTSAGSFIATVNFWTCLAGAYRTPAIAARVRCVYTNTVPVGPYRGAGRPEANLILERLVDEAARRTGIDRAELRLRNMIPPAAMPYRAPTGVTYDSGDFPGALDEALRRADAAGFERRRAEARARGKLRGLGIASYVEVAGGPPTEWARLAVEPDGAVLIHAGTHPTGQGHATVFPRLVAERLGLDTSRVRLMEGDSAVIGRGVGSFASRSLVVGGAALLATCERLVETAKALAGGLLEAAPADIEYAAGRLFVAGTDRALTLGEIATRRGTFFAAGDATVPPTFPNGCHVSEIEIDAATGTAAVMRHVAVDDCGNAIDRTIVDGQVQGGIAQGLGQVLFEQAVYEAATGQPLTGSYMDYGVPHADDLPTLETEIRAVPSRTNPLGAKGVGEAGTTGALCAGYAAVLDALASVGVAEFQMPATPQRLWSALRGAG